MEEQNFFCRNCHQVGPMHTAEIIVAKNRNGAVGSVNLIFRPERTRFESAARLGI